MKKPLSISFNNTTPPPQVDAQQDLDSNSVLYAETGQPGYVNTVEIGFTNNTGDQNFAPGDYLELDFHELCYDNSGQIEGVDAAKVVLADSSGDWEIPANQTGSKIKLQCASAFTWEKGENRSVTLNIPVNPITDPVKNIGDFAISDASHFGDNKPSNEPVVTMVSFGAGQKNLPVRAYFVDPSVKVPDIPAKDDDVVFITPAGLDDIPNKLSFELDYSRLTGKRDQKKLGVPELILSIQAGDDDWDLAPPNSAEGIALNIAHDLDYETDPKWTISHVDNENFIQFKCVPEVGTPLLPLTGGKKIRLELTNIVTALSDGTVNMTLQISGMQGFADWCWFLTIQKEEPEPQIVSFDIASPTNALLSVGEAVKLTWQTFAIKALELNYISLVGNQVTEKLSGKLTEKDGYEVVPAATNSDVPDDFTATQALPLNLVATKADGNTIPTRQVVVTMEAPAPVLEISNMQIYFTEAPTIYENFYCHYLVRYGKSLDLNVMVKGINKPIHLDCKNGQLQYTEPNLLPLTWYPDKQQNPKLYYFWYDSQCDLTCSFTVKNEYGTTTKDVYIKELNTRIQGGDGGDVFNPVIVQSVAIRHGNFIDAIIINGIQHGGGGGSLTDTLTLSDGEYISYLEARGNWFNLDPGIFSDDNKFMVRYIKIQTNQGRSIEGGTQDESDGVYNIDGQIVMLGGRSGEFLDALEIYFFRPYDPPQS